MSKFLKIGKSILNSDHIVSVNNIYKDEYVHPDDPFPMQTDKITGIAIFMVGEDSPFTFNNFTVDSFYELLAGVEK